MMRIIKWLAGLVIAAAIVLAILLRIVPDDPGVWHVDPAVTERTGKPNDYLVAPEGATEATPDRIAAMHTSAPRDLLFQLDAVARPAGAEVIGGSLDDLWVTYVDRSMVLGFPDYISVRAVPVEGGSALIIWSRSRYGYSDWGVNKSRVDGWLAQIGE